MDTLKGLSEAISAILGVLSIFLFAYLLIMGFAHRAGKNFWFDWEQKRRKSMGKPNIELSSKSSAAEFPWKDPSLIQGGFTALTSITILSMYVVIMTMFFAYQGEKLSLWIIAVLLGFPVAMVGIFALPSLIWAIVQQYKLSWKAFGALVVVNLACGIVSFFVFPLLQSEQLALYSQIGLLLIVSASLSYVSGIPDGFKDADIENKFPVVDIVTNKGRRQKLRFYEKTDSDYRFISEKGVEYIIPSAYIVEIIYVSQKENEKTMPSSVQDSKPKRRLRD